MKRMRLWLLLITASFIGISGKIVFGQDEAMKGSVTSEGEAQMQWIWGEVVKLDSPNKAVSVKYLDYETDQEKEMCLSIDDKTTYENIKSIDDIKAKDVVSIDYMPAADGKNMARNISVEKPEETPVAEEQATVPGESAPPAAMSEEASPAPQQ